MKIPIEDSTYVTLVTEDIDDNDDLDDHDDHDDHDNHLFDPKNTFDPKHLFDPIKKPFWPNKFEKYNYSKKWK